MFNTCPSNSYKSTLHVLEYLKLFYILSASATLLQRKSIASWNPTSGKTLTYLTYTCCWYPDDSIHSINTARNRRCSMSSNSLTLSQWSSSGNPVAIQCAWNSDPIVHWNATGEMPVCFQWCSSRLSVAFQWSSSVFQLCKLTLDCHWDTTGCKHQPVWFQWHPSVLVAPVVFQCVPIMQINTGSPLEHHWVLASASVVPVASKCNCGSSGLPVRSVQWYRSVLTESGLEVIGSGHFPACDA